MALRGSRSLSTTPWWQSGALERGWARASRRHRRAAPLDRVGDAGLEPTGVEPLEPVDVRDAFEAWGLDAE